MYTEHPLGSVRKPDEGYLLDRTTCSAWSTGPVNGCSITSSPGFTLRLFWAHFWRPTFPPGKEATGHPKHTCRTATPANDYYSQSCRQLRVRKVTSWEAECKQKVQQHAMHWALITLIKMREEDTSCCPVGLVSRTGLPMQTLAAFIDLRLSWAKADLQLLGVLSSAVREINQNVMWKAFT